MPLLLSDFDFPLPEALIAQAPADRRDGSRLLVLDRKSGERRHTLFPALLDELREGDLLVANDVRVIPARLLGKKAKTGGKAELLLCRRISDGPPSRWEALGQASKGLAAGTRLVFEGGLEAEVEERLEEGGLRVALFADDVDAAIAAHGRLPLPPYITRVPAQADLERYQTVFAKHGAAAAAPTAGLHFTPELLAALPARGVGFRTLTLDVGPGTFLPVRTENLDEHVMHAEHFSVPEETAAAIAATRARGGRVIAIGTTTLRALETAARDDGTVQSGPGISRLFVRPGFQFRAVDALVTNFHLPKSTLLMLVSAFAGRDSVLAAYGDAVAQGYRFFSYGDAMFIR